MITVHLWQGLYGHAALEITDNPKIGHVYVSFHPQEKTGILAHIPAIPELLSVGVKAVPSDSYERDMELMGRRKGNNVRNLVPHDACVTLHNLDEDAVFEYWSSIIKDKKNYALLFRNCSSVVAQCLSAGWIGTFDLIKNKALDEKFVEKKMEEMKNSVVHRRVVQTGLRSAPLREEVVYRYTGEAISPSDVAIYAKLLTATGLLAVGLPLSKRYFNAGMTMVFSIPLLVGIVGNYDKYFWDPRLVHNVALYLKEQTEQQ